MQIRTRAVWKDYAEMAAERERLPFYPAQRKRYADDAHRSAVLTAVTTGNCTVLEQTFGDLGLLVARRR